MTQNTSNEQQKNWQIFYPGEATEWKNAANDNRMPFKNILQNKIIWYVAAAAGASVYFVL